jgi:hypothetical protein
MTSAIDSAIDNFRLGCFASKNSSFTKIFYLFQSLTIDTLVIGADDQECKVLLEKKQSLFQRH